MLKAVQGFEFTAQAPAGSAQMVISDGANRYVVGADGSGKVTASAEETARVGSREVLIPDPEPDWR